MKINKRKLLFFGYSDKNIPIIKKFRKEKFDISFVSENEIYDNYDLDKYDFCLSFGYKKIFKNDYLKKYNNKIINLHISYLPFNKGAYPNYYSFVYGGPTGVTIHEINSKIDEGDIILRKYVYFEYNKSLTFTNTYNRLIKEIQNLFIDNFDYLTSGNYSKFKQRGRGSFYKKFRTSEKFWTRQIITK